MTSSYEENASKSALRSSYLELCRNFPEGLAAGVDRAVVRMLGMVREYREAGLVLAYVPFHEEMDTRPVIERALAQGKRVALPYLQPRTSSLSFFEVASADGVELASRGMRVPPVGERPLEVGEMVGSVCLVPGLVFDGEGYRVGYGAGYYDEFLAFYPGEKIGLVRSMQVSSNPLPHDEHDVPVDVLVTEGSVWRCRRL